MYTVRPKDAIKHDFEKQLITEDFYKQVVLVSDFFKIDYLISEKNRTEEAISIYKSRITEHDFNKCNAEIKKQIKELKKQLSTFNYLLISDGKS